MSTFNRSFRLRRKHLGIGTVAALVFGLTACGGSADAHDEQITLYGSTITKDEALAERLPAEWKSGITVPIKVLQPNGFVDDKGQTVGLQPDLIRALGAKWGIPVTVEAVGFDGHVPGVMAGKYAFTVSTGDHEQRRAVLDMVDYIGAGVAWLTTEGSPIQTTDDICGHRIGVIKGTDQEQRAEEKVKECDDAGIPGTTVNGFSNTLVTVPLEAGRVDVAYDSVSFMLYIAENEPEKFSLVGDTELLAPLGMGVKKGEQEKVDLIKDSLETLKEEGVYNKIMEEWGQQDLAFEDFYINGEGMPPL